MPMSIPSTTPGTLTKAVVRRPRKVCLDFLGRNDTFAQLDEEVVRIADRLSAIGFREVIRSARFLITAPMRSSFGLRQIA